MFPLDPKPRPSFVVAGVASALAILRRTRRPGERRYGLCGHADETQKKVVESQKYLDNWLECPYK
jgi:hypothetical protein